uniref:Uncharacterized protein n=1 Tax=Tanacetum cinerariifolium TaxID=118510 RepID=A0A6L2N0J0_TANCI|nr:hypothetical protein [Tanacetum cinerariifolium]
MISTPSFWSWAMRPTFVPNDAHVLPRKNSATVVLAGLLSHQNKEERRVSGQPIQPASLPPLLPSTATTPHHHQLAATTHQKDHLATIIIIIHITPLYLHYRYTSTTFATTTAGISQSSHHHHHSRDHTTIFTIIPSSPPCPTVTTITIAPTAATTDHPQGGNKKQHDNEAIYFSTGIIYTSGRHSRKEKVTLDDLFLLHIMDGGARVDVPWSRDFTFEYGKARGFGICRYNGLGLGGLVDDLPDNEGNKVAGAGEDQDDDGGVRRCPNMSFTNRLRVIDERLGTLSTEVHDLTYVVSGIPNGEALRKCILSGPYKPTTVLVEAVEVTNNSPAGPEHTTVETPTNMSLENKAHFLAEKEAIHLILTETGDGIYSTVDACQMAHGMWEAIERLQQGESLNIQDLEWSRFVTIVKQQHKLDEVSYHKLFDILKQYQNKVNELRAEKLARNANPLALVATAQADRDPYYQSSRSHRSSAPSPKPLIPSRSHTSTRHKGKEIAKLITPSSETASEEDSDREQAQRDKDMQKNLALIEKYFKKIYKPTNNNLRTSSNSKYKNVDTTPWYKNDDHSRQIGNQRTVNVAGAREKVGSPDFAYHKEKMLLCKQVEQGVPLQAEQYDWLADTDEEVDEHELEALYSYTAKIQEVPTADSGTDSEPVEQNDQNDVESDDEHVMLANLIVNLKLDVDENKKIQKQLKKANTTLAQELKECKAVLAKASKSLGESISVRDSFLVALQTKQTEFEKYKAFND